MKKVTFNGAARPIRTLLNLTLLLRDSFNMTFLCRSGFVTVLPAREQCYYRSIFAVECTLRREQRTETRERSENENERYRGSFP